MRPSVSPEATRTVCTWCNSVAQSIVESARFDVVMSIEQLAEIGRVLAYPKIHRKLNWDEQRIEQFIRQLYVRAEVVDLRSTSVEVPRDPQDSPILAALIASGADALVSGDRDLLELRGKYPIQTPAEFVRRL